MKCIAGFVCVRVGKEGRKEGTIDDGQTDRQRGNLGRAD